MIIGVERYGADRRCSRADFVNNRVGAITTGRSGGEGGNVAPVALFLRTDGTDIHIVSGALGQTGKGDRRGRGRHRGGRGGIRIESGRTINHFPSGTFASRSPGHIGAVVANVADRHIGRIETEGNLGNVDVVDAEIVVAAGTARVSEGDTFSVEVGEVDLFVRHSRDLREGLHRNKGVLIVRIGHVTHGKSSVIGTSTLVSVPERERHIVLCEERQDSIDAFISGRLEIEGMGTRMHIRGGVVDVCSGISTAGITVIVDERPAFEIAGVIFKRLKTFHIRQGEVFTTSGEVGGDPIALVIDTTNGFDTHSVVGEGSKTAEGSPRSIADRNRNPVVFRLTLVLDNPCVLKSARRPVHLNGGTDNRNNLEILRLHTSAQSGEVGSSIFAEARCSAVGFHTHQIMGAGIDTDQVIGRSSHIDSGPVGSIFSLVFHGPGNLVGIAGRPRQSGGMVGNICHRKICRLCASGLVVADHTGTHQLDIAAVFVEIL